MMPGATSRNAFDEFLETTHGDTCVIPSEIFADLMKDKMERDDSLCNVLQRIAVALETGEESKKKHFRQMEMKMDQLIIAQNDTNTYETCMTDISEKITNLTQIIINSSELIADKIESTEITDKEAINKNIVKLKDLRAQYLRSEKTSELIDELLNDENKPYIQKKFRVKVSNETHNDELILSRNVAIDNAKTEILYMKCRMKRWEEEINSLKDSIALSISKPDITPQQKETFKQQMSKNEDMALKERDEAVKKIRDSRENEIKSGVDQFLLIYPGSNQRGRYNWSQNFSARYRKRKCRSDQRNWRNN